MKLSRSIYSFLLLSVLFLNYSCGDETIDYGPVQLSADAQIYAFSLKGTPITKADSAAYPILERTRFTINQFSQEIFNTDSLPYQISLRNFYVTLTHRTSPSKVEIIYRSKNDSIVEWNETDSINFAKNDISIRVTPEDGNTLLAKTYSVNLRIHQIDPDTLIWKQVPSLNYTQASTSEKVLLYNDTFFRYYISPDGSVALQTASRASSAPSWNAQTLTGLPNDIRIKSITFFGGNFFAVSQSGDSYYSGNATTWYNANNGTEIQQILGVIPETESSGINDSLLVVTKEGSDYYLVRTKDFTTFGAKTLINNLSVFDYDKFLNLIQTNFFTNTYFNRENTNSNFMLFTGFDTGNTLISWVFSSRNSKLLVSKNTERMNPFGHGMIMQNNQLFAYDQNIYALSNDSLYISSDLTKNWFSEPEKQVLHENMKINAGQTILVDDYNFIWIFGREATSQAEVWKGRLNRLIK